MPRINVPGSHHTAPTPQDGYSWLPYTDNDYLSTLRRAMQIIQSRVTTHKPCNDAFRSLPGGRSFQQVWYDPDVWISFFPSRQEKNYGATLGKEITLSAYTLAMGRWTTTATLIHELAHVNGAGGGDTQAEDTLKACLLRNLHDPAIIGSLTNPKPGSSYA